MVTRISRAPGVALDGVLLAPLAGDALEQALRAIVDLEHVLEEIPHTPPCWTILAGTTGWSAFVTWGHAGVDAYLAADVAAELATRLAATVYDVCLLRWDEPADAGAGERPYVDAHAGGQVTRICGEGAVNAEDPMTLARRLLGQPLPRFRAGVLVDGPGAALLMIPTPLLGASPPPPTRFAVRLAGTATIEAIAGGVLVARQSGHFEGERACPGGLFDEDIFGPLRRDAEGRLRLESWAGEDVRDRPQATRFGRLVLPRAVVHPWALRTSTGALARTLFGLAYGELVAIDGALIAAHDADGAAEALRGGEAVAELVRRGALPPDAARAVIRVLPVLPAGLRPIIEERDRTRTHDANLLYALVRDRIAGAERMIELGVDDAVLAPQLTELQRAIDALFVDGAVEEDHPELGRRWVPCDPDAEAQALSFRHLLAARPRWPDDCERLILDHPSRPFSKRWDGQAQVSRGWLEASALEVVPLRGDGAVDEPAHEHSLLDRRLRVFRDVYTERFGEGTRILDDTPGDGVAPAVGVYTSPPLADGTRWLLTSGMSASPMPGGVLFEAEDPRIELAMRVPAALAANLLQHLAVGLRALVRHPFSNGEPWRDLHSVSVGHPIMADSALTAFVFVTAADPAVVALRPALPGTPPFLLAVGLTEAEVALLGRTVTDRALRRVSVAALLARLQGVTDPDRADTAATPTTPLTAAPPAPESPAPGSPPEDDRLHLFRYYTKTEHPLYLGRLGDVTRPFASLVTLFGIQLDLVEHVLDRVRDGVLPPAELHRWLRWARITARAVVFGWPRAGEHRHLEITWPGEPTRSLAVRHTEEAIAHPLGGGRWTHAMAVAWLTGDHELAGGLADPSLVATISGHAHESRVPSRHRVRWCRLLATLARGDATLDSAGTRAEILADIDDPLHGEDGSSLRPESLRTDVLPLVSIVEALGGVRRPDVAALRAAFATAAEVSAWPFVLVALAAVARRLGLGELLPSHDACLPGAPIRGGEVQVRTVPAPPALSIGDRTLDGTALDRLAEALWRADETTWSQAWERIPFEAWHRVLIYLVIHHRWAPRSYLGKLRLAVALDDLTRPGSAEPRLTMPEITRALAALDEAGRDTDDLLPSHYLVIAQAVMPSLARAHRATPFGTATSRWFEALILFLRALDGDALTFTSEQAAWLVAFVGHAGYGNIVVSDTTGITQPADPAAIVAILTRTLGRRWFDALPARHPMRPLEELEAEQHRQDKSEIAGMVAAARRGAIAADYLQVATARPHIVRVIDPVYDGLLAELAHTPSIGAARAASMLRAIATHALAGATISEPDVRYLVREPAIFDPLPADELAGRLENERRARVRLVPLLDERQRIRVLASWNPPAPPPPAAPEPVDPAPPKRRRRVVPG